MSRRGKGQRREARTAMEGQPQRMEGEQQSPGETMEQARGETGCRTEQGQACGAGPLPTIAEAPLPAAAREGQAGEGARPDASGIERERRGGMLAVTLALCSVALLAAAGCGAAAFSALGPMAAEEAAQPEQVEEVIEVAEEEAHAHEWAALTETVHHDAVTRTVEHPAEYAQQTAYHTICNECGEILDNAAEQHMEATGHSGYTVNVPREETVLAKGAWSEVVVVEDAYDEVKVNGSICLGCGEVQRAAAAAE